MIHCDYNHVYHIKGKVIEGSPFNATTNDNKRNMLSYSINRRCQQK